MKNKGVIFMIVGIVMITSSLFLLLHNIIEDRNAANTSAEIMEQIHTFIKKEEKQDETPLMPIVEIDEYGYIGYLCIPSIDLELPVFSEWDEARMLMAPCRQRGSLITHDLVIAGHGMPHLFGNLSSLKENDSIVFVTMSGKSIQFTVRLIEILDENQSSQMFNSKYDLTLYTCTFSGKQRITIRAMANV